MPLLIKLFSVFKILNFFNLRSQIFEIIILGTLLKYFWNLSNTIFLLITFSLDFRNLKYLFVRIAHISLIIYGF